MIVVYGAAITLLLAIIAPFFSPFFRYRYIFKETSQEDSTPEEAQPLVPVTILLTVHDNAKELEKNLPLFLSQDYPTEFEVIVVAEQGDSATEDVLKRHSHHPHLYSTFIPSSSRYMSRKKLAITLGVKAAKYEWIILTEPSCSPVSPRWLYGMSCRFTDDMNLVMGYSNYTPETKTSYRLEQLYMSLYLLRLANRGTVYRACSMNLAFRKSIFIQQEGYRSNLHLLRGEYDFLVNKYAEKNKTAAIIDKEAWIVEDKPQQKAWKNKHIFYLETRKYLRKRTGPQIRFTTDMLLLHLSWLFIALLAICSFVFDQWIWAGIAGFSMILTIGIRMCIVRKIMRYFTKEISVWRLIPFELTIVWRRLYYLILHREADKRDFTSHKL